MSQKMDGLTKDLDDLVSLYEIVSEQMNPFVGLSNVTKKRIEALETFSREIENLDSRMQEVEAVIERNSVQMGDLKHQAEKRKKIVEELTKEGISVGTDVALKPESEIEGQSNEIVDEQIESQGEVEEQAIAAEGEVTPETTDGEIPDQSEESKEQINDQLESTQEPIEFEGENTQELPEEKTDESSIETTSETSTEEPVKDDIQSLKSTEQQEESTSDFSTTTTTDDDWLTDDVINIILENSLGGILSDDKLDSIIDEFVNSLK